MIPASPPRPELLAAPLAPPLLTPGNDVAATPTPLPATDASAHHPPAVPGPSARVDAVKDDPQAFLAWLVVAFDAFSTPTLAALLAPSRDQVRAAGLFAADHEDRRVRRRLRDLLRRLEQNGPAGGRAAQEAVAERIDPGIVEDEPMSRAVLDALVALVRPHTAGRRVLFVSNRHDPDLEARLAGLLQVEITICDGSLRRVQAQCSRIARRSYDLVLSATGFQVHGVDGALARAAGNAGVPYVRVNRGRPLTVLQSIAREFGLVPGSASARLARSA